VNLKTNELKISTPPLVPIKFTGPGTLPSIWTSEEPRTSSLPTVPGMGVKLMLALVIGALRWQCGVTEAWNLRTLPPGKVTVTTCDPNISFNDYADLSEIAESHQA